jgi:phage gp46-like protein
MANDIKFIWDENFLEGDLQLNKGDLLREKGLTTAVLISLFTDARADEDDKIDDKNDIRGYWADAVDGISQITGSKLWQYERIKTTQTVLVEMETVIREALQWLEDDGVAEKVEIFLERQGIEGNDRLALNIKIYQTDKNITALRFDDLWKMEVKYAI